MDTMSIINNGKITNIPINTEIKEKEIVYLFDKNYYEVFPIINTSNQIYDYVLIPLNKYGLIKDFYFTITNRDDNINGIIDIFVDSLIEIEIIYVQNSENYVIHSKLDSQLLNKYIPLKKLGYSLPLGLYYYTFSSDPCANQMLGGLYGNDYLIRIKIKKMNGIVKFYLREYNFVIF